MTDANLLYTDVETALRESVRALLSDQCPAERVADCYDGDSALATRLWRPLAADLGLAGLLVPEERGGAGASAREAAVVLEELGRACAPVPFLTSAVIATRVLLGTVENGLLSQLAEGQRTAALAVPLATSPHEYSPTVQESGDGALTGQISGVAGALEADVLLVPARRGGELALHALDVDSVTVTPVVSLDMTRQLADLDLNGATGRRILNGGTETVLSQALELGTALLASEQLGLAQWCLDATVAYLGERIQFGRTVGGFQALKHRLADLYVRIEAARTAARYAAGTEADRDPDRHVAALMASTYCSETAVAAAEECVQLHGGIGMTWEHPAHLYLKRAQADQLALGSPQVIRRRLGDLVDLPMPTSS
ncbi:acyl-CoA dehydrogenase family protein [Lipingzhangella sp. LS1_29]|uniref:Acyl-CoA dehydrogenase family protein n=1 Tax=Lipingzhangella rawalii TaxID=2055835 RepID=A0ABU2H6X8_9ACTN|nr:acyl-CoA dehydrogenase family protein [Lipingzhangella rawalii]MDS1271061.1 acyl-CoA dehydrogenase family protein [Lipingzhangella rawalii]